MMKPVFILIAVNLCMQHASFGQYYKLEPLKDSERKKGMQFHYAYRGDYAGVELFLFKNGTFRFENYTCMSDSYSTGTWVLKNELITFRSSIRTDDLPVKLVYRQRNSSDKYIKRLAVPVDLNGNDLKAGIHINTDSTTCFYGDGSCFGEYKRIDSIQIEVNRFSSKWLKVKEGDDIVQPVIETTEPFGHYLIFDAVYRRSKYKLIEQVNK